MDNVTKEFYDNLTDDEKRVLIEWYMLSSETYGILRANGDTPADALKYMRNKLTLRTLGKSSIESVFKELFQ